MDAGAIIQSVVIRIPVQWNILNIRMSRATGETGDLLPEDSGKILEEGKITEKGKILKEKLWKINDLLLQKSVKSSSDTTHFQSS